MPRRHRRAAGVLTSAVVLGAVLAPGAAAHVTIQPSASRPAELQRYRVVVPNEEASAATTGVDLRLPPGITFALTEDVAGWRTEVVKQGSTVTQLRWRGGSVPPGSYAELRFIARNPVKVGTQTWKALQRYSDGDVVRWIGAAGGDLPAPVTTLSEDAAPVDVVSTHGEATPVAAPSSGSSSGSGSASAGTQSVVSTASQPNSGRDGLTVALALAGLLLGAAALALQLLRRHRTPD